MRDDRALSNPGGSSMSLSFCVGRERHGACAEFLDPSMNEEWIHIGFNVSALSAASNNTQHKSDPLLLGLHRY